MTKKKTAISLLMVFTMLVSIFRFTPVHADAKTWTSVWSTSMVKASVGDIIEYKKGALLGKVVNLQNNTCRMALKVQGSGEKLRLVLANDFGSSAQPIQAISVGKTNTSNTRLILKNTRKSVTYNGKTSFSIPAGERITTDDINISVTAGEMITVSIYYGGKEPGTIGLYGADSYTHLTPSDFTGRDDFGTFGLTGEQLYSDDSNATAHYDLIPSLCEVDVYGDQMDGCCVIFGDSTVTNEVPNYLAENLRANGINNISVVQAAIKGNRLTADGAGKEADFIGINGVDRFTRDVLSQANVKYVIVKLGDNDIIHPYCNIGAPATDYYDMQDDYRYIKNLAEENGIIFGICEIAPWKGYTRENSVNWTAEIDQLRLDMNEWIMEEYSAHLKFPMTYITDSDGYSLYADETTDGAHPNEKGQRKLANLFKQFFTQVLE